MIGAMCLVEGKKIIIVWSASGFGMRWSVVWVMSVRVFLLFMIRCVRL